MFAVASPFESMTVFGNRRAGAGVGTSNTNKFRGGGGCSSETSHECRICRRSFAKQYNLLMHERVHHSSSGAHSFKVFMAAGPVTTSTNSSTSKNDENSSLFPCNVCGKVFGKQESLKNHKTLHSPPAVPKELKGFLFECVTY